MCSFGGWQEVHSPKDRAALHVHLGTADRVAKAVLLDSDCLEARGSARVQLVFEAPFCAGAGDAFVVRDAQARRTVGGGIVIDPCPPARRRRSAERLAYLTAIQNLLQDGSVLMLLENAATGIPMQELMHLTGLAPDQIPLPARARIVGAPEDGFAILDSHWRAVRTTVPSQRSAIFTRSIPMNQALIELDCAGWQHPG